MSGTVPVTGEPGPLLAKLAVDVFHEPTGLPAALPVRVYCQSGDLNPLRPGRQAPGQRRRKVVPNADVTDQPTGTNQDPCPVENLAVEPRGDAFRAARDAWCVPPAAAPIGRGEEGKQVGPVVTGHRPQHRRTGHFAAPTVVWGRVPPDLLPPTATGRACTVGRWARQPLTGEDSCQRPGASVVAKGPRLGWSRRVDSGPDGPTEQVPPGGPGAGRGAGPGDRQDGRRGRS